MSMRTSFLFVVTAALALLGAAPAAAQTPVHQRVIGEIVDRATLTPIQGAFVQLVDSTGKVQAAVLSDPAGRFLLEAPLPGRYTLRAERIGYANAVSHTLVVSAGQTLPFRFAVAVRAISLEGLKVTASQGRCRLSRQAGTATNEIWDEARKALQVVVWLQRQRGVPFQDVVWNRTLNLVTRRVEEGDRRVTSGFGKKSFWSATGEDLEQGGFVRPAPGHKFTYYGLDAQALLSDAFLQGHCIHAVEPRGGRDKGLVGLSFKPADPHGLPDIEGTLWLDRRTSELRYLEFEYTRQPFSIDGLPESYFGGRVDFERLANGAWVVSKWWLRMPSWGKPLPPSESLVPLLSRSPVQRALQDGLRIREKGGEVTFTPRIAPSTDSGTAEVTGTVYDSADGGPVQGAIVFLADDYTTATTTDAMGRFDLPGLPAGHHVIAFFGALTDSLDLPVITHPVVLRAHRSTDVMLAVPRSDGCPSTLGTGTIVGFVQSVANGAPLAAVPVRAEWHAPGESAVSISATDTTDARGRYLVCGVPVGGTVRLSVPHGATTRVRVGSSLWTHQDLLTSGS